MNVQSDINIASTPLRRRQIKYRYKFTDWMIREARDTGFIGPIKGPSFIRIGSHFVASQHEMDCYIARSKEFSRRFADARAMTKFINAYHAGKPYSKNWDAIKIAKMMPYLDIMPPHFYQFEKCKGVMYWSMEDLQVFKSYIDKIASGSLRRYGSTYDDTMKIWRPEYPSPADFSERYTDETRNRVVKPQ